MPPLLPAKEHARHENDYRDENYHPTSTKKVLSALCVYFLQDPLFRRLSLRLLGIQRL